MSLAETELKYHRTHRPDNLPIRLSIEHKFVSNISKILFPLHISVVSHSNVEGKNWEVCTNRNSYNNPETIHSNYSFKINFKCAKIWDWYHLKAAIFLFYFFFPFSYFFFFFSFFLCDAPCLLLQIMFQLCSDIWGYQIGTILQPEHFSRTNSYHSYHIIFK